MNKRRFFRLEFSSEPPELPCEWAIRSVGERRIKELYAAGTILDLSAGGLRFQSEIDLPIRLTLHLRVRFVLQGQSFDLTALALRKVDTRSDYQYQCEWIDADEDTHRQLLQALNAVALSRPR